MSTTATRRPILALVAALSMFMAMIAFAPPAQAAVACGDVVTTDVVLDADLVCSGTHGIVVGADGIAIDMNGFTIRNLRPTITMSRWGRVSSCWWSCWRCSASA